MEQEEILHWLGRWERELPVIEWTANGVQAWPLLRIQLGARLWRAHNAPALEPSPGKAPRAKRFPRLEAVFELRKVLQANRQDAQHVASTRGHRDVLFLVGPNTRINLLGRYYNMFCDPLADLLEREGKSSLTVEYAGVPASYSLPRYRQSLLMQPEQLLADISASALRVAGQGWGPLSLPGYEQLAQSLRELGKPRALPELETLKWETARLAFMAAYFTRLLQRTRPKLVAAVCYYNTYGMALNLAARRLGILSVDLQHGAYVRNPAYDRWTAIPNDGLDLLPDFFWCWTASDAAVIDAWPNRARTRHRALVGGQPWTCALQDTRNAFVAQLVTSVERLRARTPEACIVLLSLQWDAGFTALMKQLIVDAPSWVHFWVRLHPAMVTERAEIKRWIAEHAADRCTVDEATDLPLPVLLRFCDVHCTRHSTVVQEAAAARVPSILLDAVALASYGAEVSAGWAELAETVPAVLSAIARLTGRDRQGRAELARLAPSSLGTPATLQAALSELLGRASG